MKRMSEWSGIGVQAELLEKNDENGMHWNEMETEMELVYSEWVNGMEWNAETNE